jgi:uncharacterized protein YutE (UPF0331/DUF86 family)/predicted nucleotidyltransferase
MAVDSTFAAAIIADYFGARPDVAAVYLFGSVARGTAHTESDVDIGVLYQSRKAPTLMAQPFAEEADLAEQLARPVQIIAMNGAPADLVHRILRDGILVLEQDKSRRIAFEVQSRNEYFDILPMLRAYRETSHVVTDADLIPKKLAFIQTCLTELRTLARVDRIAVDVKERRFVEHTLQICIQAVQDVASHIVSDQRLGEPSANVALFTLLVQAGWLREETAQFLRSAVGFRNVLVHGYTVVDPQIVRTVLEQHLGDIEQFVAEIGARLSAA